LPWFVFVKIGAGYACVGKRIKDLKKQIASLRSDFFVLTAEKEKNGYTIRNSKRR